MITFQQLGRYGRLGNQLFQYAALVGAATRLGVDWGLNFAHEQSAQTYRTFSKFLFRSHKVSQTLELRAAFDISARPANGKQRFRYREPHFHFDPNFFLIRDETDIFGYFQSPKYFEHCAELIRKEFTFQPQIRAAAEEVVAPYRGRPTVSLHVRRGDYVCHISRGHYADLAANGYYERAMACFPADVQLLCFSDDRAWCRKHLPAGIEFIDGGSAYVDLCAMSLCRHNIIGNSTFSWWGAWLNANPDKTVICPVEWFGPQLPGHSSQDLYCEDWQKI